MKIVKGSDGLPVRITADLPDALGLKVSDDDLVRSGGPAVEGRQREAAIASLRRFRSLLPAGSFDREGANGR